MSTQLNTQDQNESIQALQSATAASKGSAHLASVGVSTTALLSALQEPSGAAGDDYSILSFILSEDESEEVQKTQAKQNFNLEQLSSKETAGKDSSDAPGATTGTATSGKNAIAKSAELMSVLQNKAQNSLSSELEKEQQVLQAELKAAQNQEKLWEKFCQDWSNYQKDPSCDNFDKLMEDIERIYGADSSEGRSAASEKAAADKANADEQHWKHESGWDRFKSGQWWDPDDWEDFRNGANSAVEKIVGVAVSTPGMFSLVLDNMSQMVKNRVQDLTLQIQFLEIIISISQGGGNAVVQMQALMNVMMKMGTANNEQSTSRNQMLNNFNIMSLTQQENKIQKQIDKIHKSEHHSGFLGFFEDIGKAIGSFFSNPAKFFESLGEGIANEVESIVKDFKEGKILQGIEAIVTDVVLTELTGGADILLAGTQLGQDMRNMVKLVVDTVGAVLVTAVELVHALIDCKDSTAAIADLSKAGDVWKTVIQNPELQFVLQVVMVAVIIAACLSGQFYLAAFMTVLFVLSASGALTDMTNAIAKSMGNSAAAKVWADVITIVIVTVCSLGVGAAGAIGEVAADEAVDAAANAAKQAADTVADSAANTGEALADGTVNGVESTADETAQSMSEKLKTALKQFAKGLLKPRAGYAALSGAGTSIMDTNFGFDIANAAIKDPKERAKWAKWIALMVDIIGAVMAAGGGIGMAAQGAAGMDQAITSGAKSFMPKVASAIENNAASITDFANTMQRVALSVGGIAGMENGAFQIDIGEMKKKLQDLMAAMNELNVSSDDLTRGMQNLTSQYKMLNKEEGEINRNVYQAVAGGLEGEIRSLLGQV